MKRLLYVSALAGVLLLPTPAFAGDSGVEVTVFGGYRSAGEFHPSEAFDDFLGPDLEVADGDVFGAALDIPISRNLFIEVFYSQQDTKLSFEGGFFLEDEDISDLDVSYLLAGVQYQWNPGQIRPFITGGVGVARLDPTGSNLDSESRLAAGFGGGVKVFFNDHFGLRLDGRALWADLDEFDYDNDCCTRRRDNGDNDLFQGEATIGLTFKF